MIEPHIFKDYIAKFKSKCNIPMYRCLIGYGFVEIADFKFTIDIKSTDQLDSWSIDICFENAIQEPKFKYDKITLIILKRTKALNVFLDDNNIKVRDSTKSEYMYAFDLDEDEIRDDCFQITIDRYLDLCERMYKDQKGAN